MENQGQTGSSGKNESQRLHELEQYNILDSASESEYNDIAALASFICEAPISLITFMDAGRQWIKSCKGVDISEIERTQSFCSYAILHPKELMIVEDFSKDSRFQNHPFVAGEPYLSFYAGMPLTNKQGYALGTICVLDTKPRTLTASQAKALKLFSIQLMHMLELRRIHYEYNSLQAKLQSGSAEAGNHIETMTAQIRQSLDDVIEDKTKWESLNNAEAGNLPAGSKTMEQIETEIKALVQKMLPQHPEDK